MTDEVNINEVAKDAQTEVSSAPAEAAPVTELVVPAPAQPETILSPVSLQEALIPESLTAQMGINEAVGG